MTRAASVAAGVLTALVPLAAVAAGQPARPPAAAAPVATLPAPGVTLPRFVAENMALQYAFTATTAVALARRVDVITAKAATLAPYVAAMRAANPRLRIFAYIDAVDTYTPPGGSIPDSVYLRNPAGGYVTTVHWPRWLVDPASPVWAADQAADCRAQLAESGYDGCYFDLLGDLAIIQPDTTLASRPVDPATGALWTGAQWLAATTGLMQSVAAADPGIPLIGNGLNDGPSYWAPTAPTSQLLGPLAGVVAENWLRYPNDPIDAYPSVGDWLQDLRMVQDAESRGKAVLALVKTWVGGSAAQVAAWHLFSLASFLLATDGRSYYEFDAANTPASILADSPWEHPAIGRPTGTWTGRPVAGGAYERDYSGGLVVVNPGPAVVRVPLGRGYTTIDGRRVSGSLPLAAHSGEVLLDG